MAESLVAKMRRIQCGLETLRDKAEGQGGLRGGDAERFQNLTAGFDRTHDQYCAERDAEVERLRAQRDAEAHAMLDRVRAGELRTVPGTADGDRDGGCGAPQTLFRGDPWAARTAPLDAADLRARALTALERADGADHAKETATRLVEADEDPGAVLAARWALASSDPAYGSAFRRLLRDPQNGHRSFTPAELGAYHEAERVTRAMNLTDAQGGYLVPFTLDPTVNLTSAGSINPLRRVARQVQTMTSDWTGVTSAGVSASWYAEEAEVADNAPSDLAQKTIPAHRASVFVPFSFEVQQDAPGFESEVQRLLMDGKDQLEAAAYTTGTGSSQPRGVITAVSAVGGSVVAPTTTETFAAADLFKVQAALPPRFRPRASWMANLSVVNLVRQMETDTNPWAKIAELGDGSPPRLLGTPLFENSQMDDGFVITQTASNYILLYGDMSEFVIADRVGAVVELIPHLFASNRRPSGQRGLLLWWRTGSDALVPNAFRLLNIATTA